MIIKTEKLYIKRYQRGIDYGADLIIVAAVLGALPKATPANVRARFKQFSLDLTNGTASYDLPFVILETMHELRAEVKKALLEPCN